VRVPIETERLVLRPFEAVDAQAAYGWFGDPVVMHFMPACHSGHRCPGTSVYDESFQFHHCPADCGPTWHVLVFN
jgi:hypothetical protein